MSEQLCSVLVTVSAEDFLTERNYLVNHMSTCSLLRGEGHGDTVLVAGHEVGVTEVSAGVLPTLVLGAVVAVPVTCLTTS